VAELGYLGQVLLAGGSYASLRDMADYGATLAFDDAENLSDPARTDPDKRALLLAGNRRGACVGVKELAADRTWRTRYVNTFTPRLFSAIRLPDPLDASLWPCDRRELPPKPSRVTNGDFGGRPAAVFSLSRAWAAGLIDDLWALALAHLAELPAYEARVGEGSQLVGRDLEPWRAILAAALWLDDQGVTGLAVLMEGLAVGYQAERPELETGDLTALVVRALLRCAAASDTSDAGDACDTKKEICRELMFTTSQVTRVAKTSRGSWSWISIPKRSPLTRWDGCCARCGGARRARTAPEAGPSI
jgi:hypothetical protein